MRRFFLGLLLCVIPLFAQESGSKEAVPLPPDPANLRANWWSYYEVDQERLGVRIEKTKEVLDRLTSDLSLQQKELAIPIIHQIVIGLNTYKDLVIRKESHPPIELRQKENYSFQEFLNLGRELINVELLRDSALQKTKINKANLRSDQSYVDALLASYLSLSKSDPSRVIKGLKVMARKIAIESDKIKLKFFEAQALRNKEKIQALESEILFARQRIQVEKIDEADLKRNVEVKQKELAWAQENLLGTQAQLAKESTLIASEQVLYQTLQRAKAEMELMEAKLELILGQVLSKPERKTVKELYTQLSGLEEEKLLIDQELEDWKSAAQLYLELALANSNPNEIDLAQKIIAITQQVERELKFNVYLSEQAGTFIYEHYITLKDRIAKYWESFVLNLKRYSTWAHKSMFKLGQAPITLYGLLKVILIIVCAYFLAKFIRMWINKFGKKQKRIKQAAIYTIGRLTYYFIFIIGIIIAISEIGLDFTTFAVIVGALSVGVGFGLQSIVNNFVSGIIVLLEKKLRIGDFIQLESGEVGRVMEINVRTTLIRTFDNLEILVPNTDLVAKKFTNWTLSDRIRRVQIPFSVAFGSDKDKIKEVMIEAAYKIPITIKERKPQVWLTKIGESSLDFELIVWVNESIANSPPKGTIAWYTWEVESALRAHNITVPFPVRDVHLTQVK